MELSGLNKNDMKRIIIYIVAFVLPALVFATGRVNVTLADGIDNNSVKAKMEKSLSSLLTEVNSAQSENRNLRFTNMSLSAPVQSSVAMLWENSPFICTDADIVEHCITTGSGYQVRNIPLIMKPTTTENFNEEEYQEAVVNFDSKGNMTSFHISISMNLYMNVVKSNMELTDLRRRQLILDYVEQFRTSYNQKDMKFLQQVYSDDALIITGRVIKQKPVDGIRMPEKITYTKQTKQAYLGRLKQIFAANKQIKVTFDAIEVMRHPTNANIYGVTLHQGYSSDRYHDDGHLFLLWDFTNESHPTIHVRTWQPDMFNGKAMPKDDVFSLSDFDI